MENIKNWFWGQVESSDNKQNLKQVLSLNPQNILSKPPN